MHEVYESYICNTRHGLILQWKSTRRELLLHRSPPSNRRRIQEIREYHKHVVFNLSN